MIDFPGNFIATLGAINCLLFPSFSLLAIASSLSITTNLDLGHEAYKFRSRFVTIGLNDLKRVLNYYFDCMKTVQSYMIFQYSSGENSTLGKPSR